MRYLVLLGLLLLTIQFGDSLWQSLIRSGRSGLAMTIVSAICLLASLVALERAAFRPVAPLPEPAVAPPARRRAHSLWEIVVVIGIFVVMAMTAIPRFGRLIRLNGEGTAKGNMGSIRSALSIYYGDMQGQYPSDLAALTIGGKYLASIPLAHAADYHMSNAIRNAATPDDAGGWLYDNITGDSNRGSVWVNCTHTDSRGTLWTSY